MTLKSGVIISIGIMIAAMLSSSIAAAAATPDFGLGDLSQYSNKQVDCDDEPDHPFCNGKRGQDGVIFCELRDKLPQHMNLTCWDNDEFANDDPLVYCAVDPETKEACEID